MTGVARSPCRQITVWLNRLGNVRERPLRSPQSSVFGRCATFDHFLGLSKACEQSLLPTCVPVEHRGFEPLTYGLQSHRSTT